MTTHKKIGLFLLHLAAFHFTLVWTDTLVVDFLARDQSIFCFLVVVVFGVIGSGLCFD